MIMKEYPFFDNYYAKNDITIPFEKQFDCQRFG